MKIIRQKGNLLRRRFVSLLKNNIFLLLILCVAFYFRFNNFPNRITMGPDSARDAFVSLEGSKRHQFPMTGPFISIAPVTTGPWYWSQLILARAIFPTNYAPWLLLAVYSLAMVGVMYSIGNLLEGKRLGLILAVITAVSPNQIKVAVQLTNPSVIGFYTSLILLLFILLVKRGYNKKIALTLGLLLGVTLNTHYQTFGLFSLIITLLFLGKKHIPTLIQILKGVSLTFLPLLYFEFLNHWYNTRHMMQYILYDQYRIWTPMRWLTFISDYWPRFTSSVIGGEKLFGVAIMIFISGVFILNVVKRKLPKIFFFFLFSFIVQVVLIRYYRGERFFGYLQFFHPFIFLFIGYTLDWVYQIRYGRILGTILFSIYLLFVLPSSIKAMQGEEFTSKMRTLTNNIYTTFGPGPFKIYKCNYSSKWDITGVVLQLTIDNTYSSQGTPLIYSWGCEFPNIRPDGSKIYTGELKNPEKIFLKFDSLYDVSIASPASILASGFIEESPAGMYQSAARWWMDEQPYRAE